MVMVMLLSNEGLLVYSSLSVSFFFTIFIFNDVPIGNMRDESKYSYGM